MRFLSTAITTAVVAPLIFLGVTPAPATAHLTAASPSSSRTSLTWSMTIGGANVADADTNRPVRLQPDRSVDVVLQATNRGKSPITLRTAQLQGGVLGLDFLVYTTRIDFVVPADAAPHERHFQFDLLGLGAQATGLMPAGVRLFDDRDHGVAGAQFPVAIEGTMGSVYGIFGLTVGGITLLLLAMAVFRLATGKLPSNRWRRGVAFLPAGLGVGFTLTFTVSALAWLLPSAGLWFTFLFVGAVVGFVAGYLSPTPDDGYEQPPTLPQQRRPLPALRQVMSLARRGS